MSYSQLYHPGIAPRGPRQTQRRWSFHTELNLRLPTTPILPVPLCDIVAYYVGFHEMNIKDLVFAAGEFFACSKSVLRNFKYMHHNLACEDAETVQMYMLDCMNNKFLDYEDFTEQCGSYDVPIRPYSRYPDPAYAYVSQKGSANEESKMQSLYQKYLFSLIKWSTAYKNEQLGKQLSALTFLDPNLLIGANLWMARFEGCMEINDVKLFETFFKEYKQTERIKIDQSALLHHFVRRNYFHSDPTDPKRKFFHALYKETRVLPITPDILMHAYYLNDKELQHLLVRNWEEARSTLGMMHEGNREEQTENDTRMEAYKLFLAGAFDEVRNVYEPTSGLPSCSGQSRRKSSAVRRTSVGNMYT